MSVRRESVVNGSGSHEGGTGWVDRWRRRRMRRMRVVANGMRCVAWVRERRVGA